MYTNHTMTSKNQQSCSPAAALYYSHIHDDAASWQLSLHVLPASWWGQMKEIKNNDRKGPHVHTIYRNTN